MLTKQLVPAFVLLMAPIAVCGAKITIVNYDAPGVGLNDPTPAVPRGGNRGTTVGEQRLIALQAAADKWAENLESVPEIRIAAGFAPLSCSDDSAIIGLTQPTEYWIDFPGATFVGTWYPNALANKLHGTRLDSDPDFPEILAVFNSELGKPGCLTGTQYYTGLDHRATEADTDLLTAATHEFAHGLGVFSTTRRDTGIQFGVGSIPPSPSAFDWFVFDTTLNKLWVSMSDDERRFSAVNTRRVIWIGTQVWTAARAILDPGTPVLAVVGPGSAESKYSVDPATFGPEIGVSGTSAELMPLVDSPDNKGLACTALSPLNAATVKGKIALVDRGVCDFVVKAANLQDAGAVAMIVVNNRPQQPPGTIGAGPDPSITIPSAHLSQFDGENLKNALRSRSRSHTGVFATLWADPGVPKGADQYGRMLLYTPFPEEGSATLFHWDPIATPNLLMEPSFEADLSGEVAPPYDLTLPLLWDLGWR